MEPSPPTDLPEPPKLAFLRRLVTTLTIVMIFGVITVVALLVIRLTATTAPRPTLPAEIVLPDGEHVSAVTFGTGWYGVASTHGEGAQTLRLYRLNGELFEELAITP